MRLKNPYLHIAEMKPEKTLKTKSYFLSLPKPTNGSGTLRIQSPDSGNCPSYNENTNIHLPLLSQLIPQFFPELLYMRFHLVFRWK